ncbi:MAG: DNA-directed RNA polymerase subunit omega [Lachnospiraceae bacterium]|nr:DNA-directed RNA polymerase subunit omega [Lachnospiraceae bacterium]
MLHPSYSDLMKVVNSEVEQGEAPVVNSRYSIVMATSKRARQIISGDEPLVGGAGKKPLSLAVEELNQGKIKILAEDEVMEEQEIYDRVEAPSQVQDLEDGQEEALDEAEQEETGDEQETEQEA